MSTKTPIKREDIRKGDVIRQTFAYTAEVDGQHQAGASTFELISRPVPPMDLPTAMHSIIQFPGHLPIMLFEDGLWYYVGYAGLFEHGEVMSMSPERVSFKYAAKKFTRLRPAAEVAAEVLEEVSAAKNLRMVPEQGTGRVVLSVGNFNDDLRKIAAKWATK